MDSKKEAVLAALAPTANFTAIALSAGVSRKTLYEWVRRYRAEGPSGLRERSRRPKRIKGTDGDIIIELVRLKRDHARWGPKKLRQLLIPVLPKGAVLPSSKTIGRILDRLGEPRVRRMKRRHRTVERTARLISTTGPNDAWTADFKGWWRTKDGKRFEPLTVRDAHSRFILCLQMIGSMKHAPVKAVFERLFEQHGLPKVIHVDNGAPFACVNAPLGLSRLSAWWIALGIDVAFSRPAHPQDNGGHERMHRDVAQELELYAEDSRTRQQAAADAWREEFNEVRPHEALSMRTPSSAYAKSPRRYRGVRKARYPSPFIARVVDRAGRIRMDGRRVFISSSLAGCIVGVRLTEDSKVNIMYYERNLGMFDWENAPKNDPESPRWRPERAQRTAENRAV